MALVFPKMGPTNSEKMVSDDHAYSIDAFLEKTWLTVRYQLLFHGFGLLLIFLLHRFRVLATAV